MSGNDELYAIARRVLLDALDALGSHRDAVVLVGAQAIYLRVGEGDLAVAPYTTDGDLAIDPTVLGETLPLEKALTGAGFRPQAGDALGSWIAVRETSQHVPATFSIDLLVPSSAIQGGGRRSVRLKGHDRRSARRVDAGLEGALVDCDAMTLSSLEPSDARSFQLRVAGPAALLVAKVHKISERQGSDRLSDKDALDVLRLLRGTETSDLVSRYSRLLADGRSMKDASAARTLFEGQFAKRQGIGVGMAIRAAGGLANANEIAASCQTLALDLLTALRSSAG